MALEGMPVGVGFVGVALPETLTVTEVLMTAPDESHALAVILWLPEDAAR